MPSAPTVASSSLLPAVYTEGVEVRQLANRGATAFATRDFAAGEIVLCEAPAVIANAGKTRPYIDDGIVPFIKALRSIGHAARGDETRGGGDDWDFWTMLRPLSLLSSSELERLRHTLYSPLTWSSPADGLAGTVGGGAGFGFGAGDHPSVVIPTDSCGTPMTPTEVITCRRFFGGPLEVFEQCFPQDLPNYAYWASLRERILGAKDSKPVAALEAVFEVLQLLHGCRVNYHTHESSHILGVFTLCCKLSHSCHPNTFWRMMAVEEGGDDATRRGLDADGGGGCARRDVRAVHIAERPIKKGEELSFSYVGTGINLLSDTSRRRDSLHPLGFVCRCDRCSVYDAGNEVCRSLRCLECGAADSVRLGGADGAWACVQPKCSFRLAPERVCDVGVLLEAEAACEVVVMRVMFGERSGAAGMALLDRITRHNATLGPILGPVLALQHPLIKRWEVVAAVRLLLGPKHFLFAVSLVGFVRTLATASTAPQALGDFISFVGDCRKRMGDGASGWLGVLVREWVPLGQQWFADNTMAFGTQHYMLWHYVGAVCDEIANGRPAPLSPFEVATAKAFEVPSDIKRAMDALAPFAEWRS